MSEANESPARGVRRGVCGPTGRASSGPESDTRSNTETVPPADRLLVNTRDYERFRPPDAGNAVFTPNTRWGMQDLACALLPHESRLCKCCRTALGEVVEVWRSEVRRTAAYRLLVRCGSVWQCPICSSRIGAARAVECGAAVGSHLAAGGSVLLFTHTFSHERGEGLGDLLRALKGALSRFYRDWAVRAVLADLGLLGRISALECTFGQGSGWHPHDHSLLFVASGSITDQHLAVLRSAWVRVCAKEGRIACPSRGLDVRGGDLAVGAYLSKLGNEVALANRKKGRGSDRFGVWQLLELAGEGSVWARLAFCEYAVTMKGRHHLRWSKGLKARFGIADRSDDDIVTGKGEEDERLYATITRDLWRGVVRSSLRGDLLAVLGVGDMESAVGLLDAFGLDSSGLQAVYETL